MITAWSPSGVQRSRSTAVLWRVLGLGLFLFGLLYTHAVSPDATERHFSSGEGIVVSDVSDGSASETPHDASDDHHGGHGQHHAGGECALGQPPQGPGVEVPCLSPLSPVGDDDGLRRLVHARHAAARDLVAPITHAADSAVLRI
ncbi:DUF6153 family protein [Streptomyces sp. NPDC050619]|uniref:DUF6153 family protein n=1 Tax=Streptomyces sp. NPDC050619 TaxID=3157214 RepID=UPI003441BB98